MEFTSIYAKELFQYFKLRSSVLSAGAKAHELYYLKKFDRFIKDNIESRGCINEAFICKWLKTLQGKKSGTVEQEVIVIRGFLKNLAMYGERVYLPQTPKVHDDYVPYIFSDKELEMIFERADNIIIKRHGKDVETYIQMQFPVILRLMYSCGMRVGETVSLSLDNVDLLNGILRLIKTKGEKQRYVPMSPTMNEILQKYCMAMGLLGKTSGWLFPSSKREAHIKETIIIKRFRTILTEIGLTRENSNLEKNERGPCLHCLRHVFAFKSFSQSERNGINFDDAVPFLSIYLGHESLSETQKYLKFSNELYPESIDAFGSFMRDILPEVRYET